MTELAALWPDEAIEAMHLAALALLERAGVRVESPAARELLLAAGCALAGEDRLTVPRRAVDEALAACPREYVLAARDPERSLSMDPDPGVTYVHNLGGARDVSDPRTGAGRRATLRDQVLATRIMHNLVHQQQVTSLWQPEDVPDLLEPLYSYLILATRPTRPSAAPASRIRSRRCTCRRWPRRSPAPTAADGVYPDRPRLLAGEPADPRRRRLRRPGGAGPPRRRGRRDPAVPGRGHHGARRSLGGARAAARRGARRRRAHAGGRARHARVLRAAAQRRRPAQRRRRQRHAGDRRRLRRRRAPRPPLRPRLRLLRALQRQQGRRRAVRLRARRQRAPRPGAQAAPALRHRRDPGRRGQLPRGAGHRRRGAEQRALRAHAAAVGRRRPRRGRHGRRRRSPGAASWAPSTRAATSAASSSARCSATAAGSATGSPPVAPGSSTSPPTGSPSSRGREPVGLPDDVLGELVALIDRCAAELGVTGHPDPRRVLGL